MRVGGIAGYYYFEQSFKGMPFPVNNETVSAKELGQWLGVTDRMVREYADRGIVVRHGRGKYLLQESVTNLLRHLREVSAGRGGADAQLDLTTEKARLAKEQADGQELKNKQLRGELVLAADVEREWSDILRGVRAGVLAVPSRVRAAVGLTPEQATELDAELRRTLTDLGNDKNNTIGGAEGADPAAADSAVAMD